MIENSFVAGSSIDAKADLDLVQGHFSFPFYFLMRHQEINFLVLGQKHKRAKTCWVPCATVSYSQSL